MNVENVPHPEWNAGYNSGDSNQSDQRNTNWHSCEAIGDYLKQSKSIANRVVDGAFMKDFKEINESNYLF